MGSKKGIILTLASIAVAAIVAMATIQSTQASIDFWLEKPATLTQGVNHLTVYCRNGGGMDGDFNLVLTFTNASFSNQTEMPYTLMDDSTVKLKFVLHKDGEAEKTIYFTVDRDTTGISVQLNLERTNFLQFLFLKANALFPTQLSYQWNGESNAFSCSYAG
ncbi:MAG: hypothetical protein ACE14S_11915 [Candidatus Bathyarchaeia archaeon]